MSSAALSANTRLAGSSLEEAGEGSSGTWPTVLRLTRFEGSGRGVGVSSLGLLGSHGPSLGSLVRLTRLADLMFFSCSQDEAEDEGEGGEASWVGCCHDC